MKYSILSLIIMSSLVTISCQKPVTNKYYTNVTETKSDSGKNKKEQLNGTEAHGGEITPSIIIQAYNFLTQNLSDTKKGYINFNRGNDPIYSFAEKRAQMWKGIKISLRGEFIQNPKNTRVLEMLTLMVNGKIDKRNQKKVNIFEDLKDSPLNVVLDKNLIDYELGPEYKHGHCYAIHGDSGEKKNHAGSSIINDLKGEICLSASKIAVKSKDSDGPHFYAIDAHERAHHFGFEEKDATDLQNYIEKNYQGLRQVLRDYLDVKNDTEYNLYSNDLVSTGSEVSIKVNFNCKFHSENRLNNDQQIIMTTDLDPEKNESIFQKRLLTKFLYDSSNLIPFVESNFTYKDNLFKDNRFEYSPSVIINLSKQFTDLPPMKFLIATFTMFDYHIGERCTYKSTEIQVDGIEVLDEINYFSHTSMGISIPIGFD